VVLNDLEFQLTLQTHLTPPAARFASPEASPLRSAKPTNKSGFSRFFSSPKKRREQDRLQQQREEEERQQRQRKVAQQEAATRTVGGSTAWDLLHEIASEEDGSFARSYVALKNHEDSCFGRPITVDMPLFNEWAVEKDQSISSSVKSKRGTNSHQVIRRPPYQIGTLTLQLLYVPKPKGSQVREEDMPKSMNACVRQMAASERAVHCEFEGYLSQQGGDCPYWRRRFFKLSAFDLTAYHETTMQRRVRISLLKATRLIDDKSTLLKADGTAAKKSGGRRKSAFADEDQAYMFVEEGFRIRFANGEAIDFYADSPEAKGDWMKALSLVIGKNASGGQIGSLKSGSEETWCDVVLKREKLLKDRVAATSSTDNANGQTSTAGLNNAASNGESAVVTEGIVGTMARPRSQPGVPSASPSMLHGFDDYHQQKQQTKTVVNGAKKAGDARPKSQLGLQAQQNGNGPANLRNDVGPAPGRLSARRHQIKSMIF
jgi:Cell division protein anillin/PH domain